MESLKWLAALAWAGALLALADSLWPLNRDEAVWKALGSSRRARPGDGLVHLMRTFGRRSRRFLPASLVGWVEGAARRWPGALDDDGWLGLTLGAGAIGSVLLWPASLDGGGLGAVARAAARLTVGFGLGCSGGLAWLHWRATERCARITRDLPGFVDLLLLGLEGGLGLSSATAEATRHLEGPLAQELAEVNRQVELGISRRDALKEVADRLRIRELSTLVVLINQAETLGGGVTRAVAAIARRLRTARVLAAERQAGEAPVKMLFPLVFCLFPSVLVLLVGPVLLGKEGVLPW